MNLYFTIGLFVTVLLSLDPESIRSSAINECDVIEFYARVDLDSGAKILDNYNNVEDGQAVLAPTRLDVGNYEVEVKRLDQNFYQIKGTDIVLETRYCSEYASYGEDAILMVESNYGYTKATLIFD